MVCGALSLATPSELRAEPNDMNLALDDFGGMSLEALLDVKVVTAGGGLAEERRLTFANTLVINREDIERMGWLTVGEALAIIPGVYVTDDQVTPSLSVRGVNGGLGSGSRLVKVMINGTPVNFRPELTAWLGLEYIPIDTVERIEVVQGPLSALYGANAFIATINVITRDPDSTSVNVASGRLSHQQKNFGHGVSAMLSQSSRDLRLMLAISADRLDRSGRTIDRTFAGQDDYLNLNGDSYFNEKTQKDASMPESVYANLRYGYARQVAGEFMLQGGLQQLDSAPEFGVNTALSHRSRVSLENYWSHGRHQKAWSDAVTTTLDAGYARGRPTNDYKLFLTGSPDRTFRPQFGYSSFTGSLTTNIALLNKILNLRLAADGELDDEDILYYRQESFRTGTTTDLLRTDVGTSAMIRSGGAGVQVTARNIPHLRGLRLMGSSRIDLIGYGDIKFPAQFSWSAGAVYEVTATTALKVIAGRAFQTPSPVLMFARGGFGNANNVLGNASLTSLGVPRLVPQTVDGAELTLNGVFKRLGVDVGVYFQDVKDNIIFQQVGNDFVATNSEALKSVGSFASVRYQQGRFRSLVTVFRQLSIKRGVLDASPPPQSPNLYGTAGGGASLPELFFNIDAMLRWTGPRGSSQSNTLANNNLSYELPSAYVVDVTVSSTPLKLFGNKTSTFVRLALHNALNTHYSEPGFAGFDLPAADRRAMLELKQEF